MGGTQNLAGSLGISPDSSVLSALSDAAWLYLRPHPPIPLSQYFFKIISAGTGQINFSRFHSQGLPGTLRGKGKLNSNVQGM